MKRNSLRKSPMPLAPLAHTLHLHQPLDVGEELHAVAVDHLGGEVDHLPKLRFMLLPPGVPFIEHLGGVEVGPLT